MSSSDQEPVWVPPNKGNTRIDKYREYINKKFSQNFKNSKELQNWTVAHPQEFWLDIWDYLQLVPSLPKDTKKAYDDTVPISSNPQWFDGVKLNYAENVLENRDPNAVALIEIREGRGIDGEKVTWADLRERVRTVRSALIQSGIKEGDRVAGIVANSVWAVVLFLASASMGVIFTSMSPDLGADGCLSRLIQVTPSILFADSDHVYRGQASATLEKLQNIYDRLEKKPKVYMIPKSKPVKMFSPVEEFLKLARKEDKLEYKRLDFHSPLIICYSSGTTGPPKCIVHQHGLLLNSRKVSALHNSLGPGEVVLQFTSTTWILFYVMMGHLATGATCICYDGAPTYPDARIMMQIIERHRVSYFGTSPRYLLELEQTRSHVKEEFDVNSIRMINTTGSSMSAEQYYWFYSVFPKHIWISNSAGGTDSSTSLLVGDPAGPIYPGEMQMRALGIDVDIADPETGESIMLSGAPGEMVVRKAFPSMPTFFWGDKDGSIYHEAYFTRFDNHDVWAQHDWLQHNPHTGGFIMTGRSDGVLNPSGIRFGSGEIYAVAEGPEFNKEIAETLCVGRRRQQDTDEQVFLFVRMAEGQKFTDELVKRLRDAIRAALSPRHVPKFILEVDAIPVTINGKKVEVAVKSLISGKDVKISSTVANPDILRGFVKYRDVEDTRKARL